MMSGVIVFLRWREESFALAFCQVLLGIVNFVCTSVYVTFECVVKVLGLSNEVVVELNEDLIFFHRHKSPSSAFKMGQFQTIISLPDFYNVDYVPLPQLVIVVDQVLLVYFTSELPVREELMVFIVHDVRP
jgi:hypothetical protein